MSSVNNPSKAGGGRWTKWLLVVFLLTLTILPVQTSRGDSSTNPIKHVVIIMQENHTFDNFFGTYPGAVNGLSGQYVTPGYGNGTTSHLRLLQSPSTDQDLCHSWACAHRAYDNGKLDKFAQTAGTSLPLSYYDYHVLPYYWDYASRYTLMDNYYSSVMGSSMPNHLYLIAGQSGELKYNFVNQTFHFKSIVDELDASHVSWRYYAGGYQYENNWNPLPGFLSFKNNQTRMTNLEPTESLTADIAMHHLPSVAWVMPPNDQTSEHPPYDISKGEHFVVSEINALMQSSYWNSTAIFVTWDDYGGWFDHVSPPQVDAYGYGLRVPMLIISPYAKQGFIDHAQSDHTSTLAFIESLFGLAPLTGRDASANNMMEAFDFSQSPRPGLVLPGPYLPSFYPLTLQSTEIVPLVFNDFATPPVIIVGTPLNLTGFGLKPSTSYTVSLASPLMWYTSTDVAVFNSTQTGTIPGPAYFKMPELPSSAGFEGGTPYLARLRETSGGPNSAVTQLILHASAVSSERVVSEGSNFSLSAVGLAPATTYQVAIGSPSLRKAVVVCRLVSNSYGSGSTDNVVIPHGLPLGNYSIQLYRGSKPVLVEPVVVQAANPPRPTTVLLAIGYMPIFTQSGGLTFFEIRYASRSDTYVDGTVILVVSNAKGQTVFYNSDTISIPAESTQEAYVSIAQLQHDTYYLSIFVVDTAGIPLSLTTTVTVDT